MNKQIIYIRVKTVLEEQINKYKKQIDDDFKTFPINKRLVQLEEAWIYRLSHKLMPHEKNFIHEEREGLRNELLKYLSTKHGFNKNKSYHNFHPDKHWTKIKSQLEKRRQKLGENTHE